MADADKKPETATEEGEEILEEEIEIEDGDDDDEAVTTQSGEIASQLMQNPEVLAALQDRLGSMVGTPSGYIQSLPKVVKRKIKALKKLQNEMIKIESKFYEEVHELECKYAHKYAPFMDRRREILTGNIEPTDSDCDWPSDEEDAEDDLANSTGGCGASCNSGCKSDELKNKAQIEDKKEDKKDDKEEENPVGIPGFWATIFKNVDLMSEMIQDHDEPILNHLNDIKVKFSEVPAGFTLEFHFDTNDFFTNTVLTKEYELRTEPDQTDPFSFEGPEIIKCKGCAIDWKKGKNVTVKLIKKTQKHKGRGTKRTVTKTVQNDSFFNFFSPPEVPEGDEPDEDTEALLAADFEIGHFIRERVVPRAVLYFTGEALEDEFEEEGEEEENEEEEGDYDEDHDPDFNPQADGQKPTECKQQ